MKKIDLQTSRDRRDTFCSKIVKKRQPTLSDEIEQKIIALYGLDMSYNDIVTHLKEIYGLEISNAALTLSLIQLSITVREWYTWPIEDVYPIVWLDAIQYKIKENGKFFSKGIYTILGVTL